MSKPICRYKSYGVSSVKLREGKNRRFIAKALMKTKACSVGVLLLFFVEKKKKESLLPNVGESGSHLFWHLQVAVEDLALHPF